MNKSHLNIKDLFLLPITRRPIKSILNTQNSSWMKLCFFLLFFLFTTPLFAQNFLQRFEQKHEKLQIRRDSIRAHKKVWTSILGGPSYTPEASFGIGGAMLMTFRLNKYDSISQRSFIPVGFNISVNGTLVIAGAGTLFFDENQFRIYVKYGYRNEPTNFFGVGFDEIENNYRSDSTTLYKRNHFEFVPRFMWEIYPYIYAGTMLDINYNKARDVNPVMMQNPEYLKYGPKYKNIGLGGIFQYDSRDDVATPHTGMFLSATGMLYGKYFGGDYNYEIIELEYRQFKNVFHRRSTLAWIVKSQIGMDDVPYSELPSFGSPYDLRGYLWGKYRDQSMAFGIVEYRHMFGTQEAHDRGSIWARLGAVAWIGTGTLGETPVDWKEWKVNYGVGLRIQIQPRKNFRLDIGQEPGQKWSFYMNMTEAF